MASPLDSFTVASSIHSMTVKTLPGDTEKIDKIQSLIEQYVEVDRLLGEAARQMIPFLGMEPANGCCGLRVVGCGTPSEKRDDL